MHAKLHMSYLDMPTRLLSLTIKYYTSNWMVKRAKSKNMNNGWCVRNSVKMCLFQAFAAVSGSSCDEETAETELLWIQSLWRKEAPQDRFPSVSFIVDMSRCIDV